MVTTALVLSLQSASCSSHLHGRGDLPRCTSKHCSDRQRLARHGLAAFRLSHLDNLFLPGADDLGGPISFDRLVASSSAPLAAHEHHLAVMASTGYDLMWCCVRHASGGATLPGSGGTVVNLGLAGIGIFVCVAPNAIVASGSA